MLLLKQSVTLLFLFCLTLQPVAAKESEQPKVKLSLSKTTVWQREQIVMTLKVISKDTLSRLGSEQFSQNGFDIVAYKQELVEKDEQLHLTLKWLIFPFIEGEHPLTLPDIHYRPNSGRAIKLEIPTQIIQVKALPIYIPPTMPVGKVTLESDWKNGWLISSKKLLEWNLWVSSSQVTKQTLPAVSRLIKSNSSLQILPLKRHLKTFKKGGGVLYKQNYEIPFKATSQGILVLPEIGLSYFDPELGQIRKVTLNSPFVLVLNTWQIMLLGLVLLLLFIFISLKLLPIITKKLEQRALRKKALILLSTATNYQQAKTALSQFAQSKDWQANTSLDQFAVQCQQYKNIDIHDLIAQLQQVEFSQDTNENLAMLTKKLSSKLRIN